MKPKLKLKNKDNKFKGVSWSKLPKATKIALEAWGRTETVPETKKTKKTTINLNKDEEV